MLSKSAMTAARHISINVCRTSTSNDTSNKTEKTTKDSQAELTSPHNSRTATTTFQQTCHKLINTTLAALSYFRHV